jgi:hypothetical protein
MSALRSEIPVVSLWCAIDESACSSCEGRRVPDAGLTGKGIQLARIDRCAASVVRHLLPEATVLELRECVGKLAAGTPAGTEPIRSRVIGPKGVVILAALPVTGVTPAFACP